MSLANAPRPKPSRPIVADYVDRVARPRNLIVHTATDEAANWFKQNGKDFGAIAPEFAFTTFEGDGCFLLLVKLNYDITEVLNFINAWRPTPTKDGLSSTWADAIENIDTTLEDQHDQ